jgi:hypothetical protein
MTGPPAVRLPQSAPGGLQARADGQQVEVRTYDGQLIRVVAPSVAGELVRSGLADDLKHSVRLKLGIRFLPARFDRPAEPPDLAQMQRKNPERYKKYWRGSQNPHVGKGALGRRIGDSAVTLRCPTSPEYR